LTKYQFLAAVNRAVGYGAAGYISALVAGQRATALGVGVKIGLALGLVTAIAIACTSFIEWIVDTVPEKRMGVVGVGLILIGFTLQSVQYWMALLDVGSYLSRPELMDAVHDNLRNLGLDRLDVVNLRVGGVMGPSEGSIAEPLTVLAELKRQGLIRHLGLSNVYPAQLAEAQKITEIVCVQNFYNVAHRNDDGFIDDLAGQGIAYVPFFPLGGFTPLQSSALDRAAASLQATPMQVALAWLLQRSPNILLIPGTSSAKHLRENLQAATLQLPPEMIAELSSIGGREREARA
jgi:aryl-alcohol dehydrogenase-like predicted oxidoreductase